MAGAVAKLFGEQKARIAAAMPAGLTDALASTGLVKGLEGALPKGATATAGAAAGAAPAVFQSASNIAAGSGGTTQGTTGGGMPAWVWVIVPIVVLALLAWLFFFRHAG